MTKDLADARRNRRNRLRPKPTTGAGKTLRYGGRTFEEWVAELKDDLSPEHRAEAVKAMSLFATRGHAEAAGEAILEAMREYNVFRSDISANEQMKFAARETFHKLPKNVSAALIARAAKSDNANQRLFALYHVLWPDVPEIEKVRVFTKFLSDPDAEVRVAATMYLVPIAPETAGLLDAIRNLCKSEDPATKELALMPIRALLNLLDKDGPKKDAAEKIVNALGPDAKDALQAIATPGDNRLLARMSVDHTPQQARRILNRLEGKPDEPETIVPPTTGTPQVELRNIPVPPQAELDLVPAEVPARPELNLISKADPASKLRYNGKPFHAWAETLREDLSPGSRTEAIEALAMFGRFGLAEAAAKEILAAMRDYSVWSMDGSAEGKLKFAATKAFKELPEKVTLPLLTTALASDSGNQRLFAATILSELKSMIRGAGEAVRAAAGRFRRRGAAAGRDQLAEPGRQILGRSGNYA